MKKFSTIYIGGEKMKKKALMILLATTMILTSCGKDSVQADMPETETNTVEQESNDETEIESGEDTLQESKPKEEITEKETVQDAVREPESEEVVMEPETDSEPEEAKVPEETKEPEEIKKAETEKSPAENRNDKEIEPEVPKVEVPKTEAPKEPGHVHSYSLASETAATCINEGTKTFKCSCGDSYTENIAKTSHNYTTESKSVTCAENGYTKTYCTSCGDVQSENVVTAPGHNLVEWWYSPPTCIYAGYMHSMKCTNCDYSEALPESGPLDHVPNEGKVVYESDCASHGTIRYHCASCGKWMYDENLPLDTTKHEWLTEDGITFCGNCYIIRE